jgi:neutral peptidase B
MPRLADDATLRRWVANDLHRLLGLTDTDHLAVHEPPRRLGDLQVVRLAQTAHGVPVVHRESRLLLNRDDRPVRLIGHHRPFPDALAPRPRLAVTEAVSMAGGAARDMVSSRLVFWPISGNLRLSYELDGRFPDVTRRAAPFERVYIDASSGQVLKRLPLTRRVLDRYVFEFALACRDAGIRGLLSYPSAELLRSRSPLVRSETANRGSQPTERLFDLFGSMHSFLDVILNRDSFDGAGAPFVAYLGVRFHEAAPWQQCLGDEFNAAWTGDNFMLLPYTALDFPAVIAHEITHGLVSTGAGLIYEHESGALDEAISDALGVTFAAWLAGGAVRNPDAELRMAPRDWQLRDPGGVMRDLRNPGSITSPLGRPYPDHYLDYERLPDHADNGGVHINSSIINQGFYLLAEGGRHPRRRGPEVEGIGALRAARIFGAAAAFVLTSNADFEAARYAFAFVAETLHGPGSREWVAVHTAMDAIGIPGDWDPPRPSQPTRQPAPQTAPVPRPAPVPQPAPTLPQPAPDPEPAPTPQPTAPTPVPASDAEPEDDAPVSNDLLAYSLIGALTLALLGSAGLVLKSRARRSVPDAAQALRPRNAWNVDAVPARAPKPMPPAKNENLLGELRPEDGWEPILLPQALLSSREGLVIGRDIELCHLEIRKPAVSRRHVRLRATGDTILVEDLNSLQGTRVDGVDLKPFEPQTLASGQTLGIAGLRYRMQRKVESRFRP